MSQVEQIPYKVKDLSLAAWGRREIILAENEMPGLMALRSKYGAVSYTHLTLPTNREV